MSPSRSLIALSSLFVAVIYGQQIGTNTPEVNPPLLWEECALPGLCQKINGSVTLDANYRWTHNVGGYTNCKNGNTWNTTFCPDPTTCAENCAVEGVNYASSGVYTSGNALTLTLSTVTNSGPRIYLLAADQRTYQTFKLNQHEFTFDVDLSQVACGMNAALYFSEMDPQGGNALTNKAGARYGTGYCDAQCPSGDNFFNGQPVSNLPFQANMANNGICCNEMDIWEANRISNAFTTHGCLQNGPYTCPGTGCTGQCDGNGCAFNAFHQGDTQFYGPGLTIDTTKKFTVVTQFITDNGGTSGPLTEIRRLYVQNGRVHQNPATKVTGMPPYSSISQQYCDAQRKVMNATNLFDETGGMKPLSTAFETGMVLVFSLWDDPYGGMTWLDGPGVGTCPGGLDTSGGPSVNVTFSNIRFGSIGSTYLF
ncbi:cellobiohydrolaseI [Flammula alnicola]|nr:cellobiohydrolaseI [Flammula alnicola]